MTREEKIKGLYSLKEYLTENPIELEVHKSLPITLIDYAIEVLEQEPTTQERQAESDKFDAAFQDGYNNGYAQARFDYEQEPTTKNDLVQERYQDLIEYFGDEKVAKTILESRKEFKAWLVRLRWNVERVDELDRELEQIKGTTKNDLGVDCVSRETVKELISAQRLDTFDDEGREWANIKIEAILKGVEELPSVTPQEPRCKDCKWWKDSDGKYRRGCGAESPCPINTHTVCCGEGYCYMFEPQESE